MVFFRGNLPLVRHVLLRRPVARVQLPRWNRSTGTRSVKYPWRNARMTATSTHSPQCVQETIFRFAMIRRRDEAITRTARFKFPNYFKSPNNTWIFASTRRVRALRTGLIALLKRAPASRNPPTRD